MERVDIISKVNKGVDLNIIKKVENNMGSCLTVSTKMLLKNQR